MDDYNICGWLGPSGDFFPCNTLLHSALAKSLAGPGAQHGISPEKLLFLGGFIKICGRVLLHTQEIREKQREWLLLHKIDCDILLEQQTEGGVLYERY